MAPYEASPTFRKLKVDTHSSSRPISSSFASISREDGEPHGVPREGSKLDSQPHSTLTASGIADFAIRRPDGETYKNAGFFEPQPTGCAEEQAIESGSEGTDLEEHLKHRKTSISFNPEVTLDGGDRASLEQPLPRSRRPTNGDPPSRPREIPILNSHVHSDRSHDSAKALYDARTGKLLDRRKDERPLYRASEPRYPLVQTTVDEMAKEPGYAEQEPVASLTSGTTASPYLEEARTPLSPSADYLLSPLAASSPAEFSGPGSAGAWPLGRRQSSQRSRSHSNRPVRSRQNSRRSTRSATSLASMSPASAFLSQWAREEAAAFTEPDDEGQEIGDHSEWIIGKQIGYGGFSTIKEVHTFEEGKKVVRAVKIVRKQVAGKSEQENERLQTEFDREVHIWRYLNHRHILPLLEVYNSPFATFCIMRLIRGGTLFNLVRNQRKSKELGLKPEIAKRYVHQVGSAVRYLHEDARIVHRDLKLENCLLDMSGPNAAAEGGNVLVCDFGMADYITNEHRSSPEPHEEYHGNGGLVDTGMNVVGSLQYAAPELINASYAIYSTAADIWAFGVIMYALLVGELPFQHTFEPKLAMMITKGEWNVEALRNAPAVRQSSADAVDLVKGCLEMDPDLRFTIADVLEHPWLEGCATSEEEGVWK